MQAETGPSGGLARGLGLLFRPAATWALIAQAPVEPRHLILRYAVPLAAMQAACEVVGVLVFGFNIANIGVHMSVVGLILGAVANLVLTIAAVVALAVVVDRLAPVFGGARDRRAAMNLVTYAATASWVGGLSGLYPSLAIPVGILAGLYSLYALYLGLPTLMRVPEDRRLTAYATILVVVLGLGLARGAITAKAAEVGGPLSASYAPR